MGARQAAIGIAVLVAVGLAVYWPSITGGFLWDDDALLTQNALVKAPDGLYRMWFTTGAVDYWPLTNSSFWLEWRLWGMHPAGYHVTNLLLHIASAGLAWGILRRLQIPGAFIAALIFVVHPVNLESVAWIAQRKNTLSLLFFLVSIHCFLRHDSGDEPAGTRWYWLSLVAFTLAMLAKGSVAILPAVLLLLAWWRRDRVAGRDLVRVTPFAVVAAGLTLVNLWFQARGAHEAIRQASLIERVLGASATVWFYLYKALLPIDLAFVYPQWHVQASDVRWWLALAGAVLVTALLVWFRRAPWARPILFAWVYYVVALVPVMGLTDVYFMKYSLVADHYQYIALLGVSAAVGAVFSRGLARIQSADGGRRSGPNLVA